MQILRNRTQNNFTIISNEILRNRELSLKDRGLLCTLIGLPDSWKFSVKGLASIIIDGKDSIRTSLIKLEKLGYVNRYKERELIPFLTSTHRRVDYDKLKENLCEEEMEYVKKMVNLIVFCLAKKDTDHPVKIAGKYLGPEAIQHLLRYKYNELFAVAKNMYSANIPVNKPDSYYLTALDNQLRINNPAEYAAMESQEQ